MLLLRYLKFRFSSIIIQILWHQNYQQAIQSFILQEHVLYRHYILFQYKLLMYSYSYNRESISRVDELLNRNEQIYQNLKLQLSQINKSNQNIHRNIHSIHEYSQEETGFNQTEPLHLEDSSSVLQETKMRSPLSPQNQNMSIEGSKVREQFSFESEKKSKREEYTLNFDNSKQETAFAGGLQEELKRQKARKLQEKARRIQQLSIELQQSKLSDQAGSLEQDRTAYLQIQNRISPRGTHSSSLRTLKNNSIYLQAIPKQEHCPPPHDLQLEAIPTFRDQFKESELKVKEEERVIRQEWMQELAQNDRMEREIQQQRQSREEELSFHLEGSRQGLSSSNNNIHTPESNLAASELLNYTPTDLLSNSQRRQSSRNKTDSFKFDCWGVSPQKSYNQTNKVSRDRTWEQRQSQCYLFAPFNKVYRSPILQVKSHGIVMLQRRSKTILGQSNTSDALKFKPNHTLTDQQVLVRCLLTGQDSLDFNKLRDSRIAILGGKDTLKKKIHLALLAYLFQAASYLLASGNVSVRVEHQESGQSQPLETIIEGRRGAEKVSLLQLERTGEDISRLVMSNKKEEVLRASRVRVEGERCWQFNIVSSNRVQLQFARCLAADRICWSINPLVKNYQEVLSTLTTLTRFQQLK